MKPTNRFAGFIRAMTTAKAARGRPKGTGIDDQQRLREIARIMGSSPGMKPTTAIKALGIADPSAIRRLRDKFNLAQGRAASMAIEAPVTPCASNRSGFTTASTPAANDAAPPLRAVPATAVGSSKMASDRALPPIETGHGLAALLPLKDRFDTVPIAAMMFGFGLNAATAFFEQQMTIATNLLKVPQVRDLVRSQIALTEFMLSVARPSPGPRLTH